MERSALTVGGKKRHRVVFAIHFRFRLGDHLDRMSAHQAGIEFILRVELGQTAHDDVIF